MPVVNSKIKRTVYDGASPIRLMQIAVMQGVIMTKYLTPVFSAISPRSGLKRAGILPAISKNALIESDILSFSISSGKMGAKKEVYVSCTM